MARFTKNFKSLEITVLIALIFAFNENSYAQNEQKRTGWWGGIEAGIGNVELSTQEDKESGSHFYLGFSGGYAINPSFLLGIELSGWLYESSNLEDPGEGDGISQFFAVLRYYPLENNGFFAKAGCGYVSHWNNEPSAKGSGGGPGLTLGVGYDFAVKSNWSISPFLSYNRGDIKHQDYNAFTFGIAFTFH